MKKRKRFYDHARLTRNPRDWVAYKKLKNEIIMDLQQAHNAYCNHMFDAIYTSNHNPILKIFGMTFQT